MLGFYAADGNAAETSASNGNQWRVHFSPWHEGQWTWACSFRQGTDVAISDDAAGHAVSPVDGATGTFRVVSSDKSPPDFRAYGALEYVGERYLRFAGNGKSFLKLGVNSPETLLSYADFDNTFRDLRADPPIAAPVPITPLPSLTGGLLRFAPHARDWREADPTWQHGKGKGLIGGINYLASQGVNSAYFVTMNVNGDGRNVWPWIDPWIHDRFDCSKLAQWDIVFRHMASQAIMLHMVTQEIENDHLLDGGELGPTRRLYYRELVARFGYHPAIAWNVGEENIQGVAQQKQCAAYLRQLDPYRHHVVIHNVYGDANRLMQTYEPLLGYDSFSGTSLQGWQWNNIHTHVVRLVKESEKAGRPWVVAADEMGGAQYGTLPDAEDPHHDLPRKLGLWGTLMAGGGGVEWYFGWQNNSPTSDLSTEDWRTREAVFCQSNLAIDFFHKYLPFDRMQSADHLVDGVGAYCFASPGEVYAIYLPNGGAARLDLGKTTGHYSIRWFDPRKGGPLQTSNIAEVMGAGMASIGDPPGNRELDWVALVKRNRANK